MTANEHGASFCDKNVLEWNSDEDYTELYTFKGWILRNVHYISEGYFKNFDGIDSCFTSQIETDIHLLDNVLYRFLVKDLILFNSFTLISEINFIKWII